MWQKRLFNVLSVFYFLFAVFISFNQSFETPVIGISLTGSLQYGFIRHWDTFFLVFVIMTVIYFIARWIFLYIVTDKSK